MKLNFSTCLLAILITTTLTTGLQKPTPPNGKSRRIPIKLTRHNFEKVLSETPNIFVMFTNNYDGKIEDYLIELFKAKEEQEHKEDRPINVGLYVGKLSQKYQNEWRIYQYPKILFFTDRSTFQAYTGGKYAPHILAWMKRCYREMSRLESVTWTKFTLIAEQIKEHKIAVVWYGQKNSIGFKAYQEQAKKRDQIYFHTFDRNVAKKLLLKQSKKLNDLEYMGESVEVQDGSTPEGYKDNEEFMRIEAEYEDNLAPHDGYFVTKEMALRGQSDPEQEAQVANMPEDQKSEYLKKTQEKNETLFTKIMFNQELWDQADSDLKKSEIFVLQFGEDILDERPEKGTTVDGRPINDEKAYINRFEGNPESLKEIGSFVYLHGLIDYYYGHNEVDKFWKSDEGDKYNWVIYAYQSPKPNKFMPMFSGQEANEEDDEI